MMGPVAVIGANGFIGTRVVEMFHLGGLAAVVRPVVRTASSLAPLSRFDLDGRVADARREKPLQAALQGCDAVIHAVAGSAATIVDSVTPVYRAAERVGVRRLVYLSTAAVHGQAPEPGTDERSPFKAKQPLPYNNAKVRAEQQLLRLRERGKVEIVILRPGIVTGPRSFWIKSFASQLLSGRAYWLNAGQGICNSIYVDNLVQALHQALNAPRTADGRAFLIGDAETVTWAQLYEPIAAALGFELGAIHELQCVPRRRSWRQCVEKLQELALTQAVLQGIPKRLRRAGYMASFAPGPASSWALPASSSTMPQPTLEMAQLYQCRYKLPHKLAEKVLGYQPRITFTDAMQRTLGWLAFAGYPVKGADLAP